MRKRSKQPRTFGRTKAKQRPQQKQIIFLNDKVIQTFEKMLHSFAWWHIIYDEYGQYSGLGLDFVPPKYEQKEATQ